MERLTVPDTPIEGGLRRAIIDTRAVKEDAMKFYWALKKYEDLGYTPEELQLCFNPPEVLYITNEIDEKKVHPIYPVDGNQIEFSHGNVYWNCRDEFGDYVELPLEGLHEEYFLTRQEADYRII